MNRIAFFADEASAIGTEKVNAGKRHLHFSFPIQGDGVGANIITVGGPVTIEQLKPARQAGAVRQQFGRAEVHNQIRQRGGRIEQLVDLVYGGHVLGTFPDLVEDDAAHGANVVVDVAFGDPDASTPKAVDEFNVVRVSGLSHNG